MLLLNHATNKAEMPLRFQKRFMISLTLRRRLSCILLLFLLTGCSGKRPAIYNLKQDDSFVQSEIIAYKMGIGGVVAVDTSLSAEERTRYADLLRKAVQDERKYYTVFPVTDTETRMGPKRYEEILHAYRKRGFLCFDTLQEIKAVTKDFRYLVMARIEADVATEKTIRRPQTDDLGNTIEGERWVELATRRSVVVSLDIYDLLKCVSVMSGSLYKRGSNAWAYGEKEGGDAGEQFLQSFGSTCFQGFAEENLQPRAPRFEMVLGKIFKGFARDLP